MMEHLKHGGEIKTAQMVRLESRTCATCVVAAIIMMEEEEEEEEENEF